MRDAEPVRFSLLDGGAPEQRAAGEGAPGPLDEHQLAGLYAYPDPPSGGWVVRANAIASLDGAATTAGTSGGLGGAGDRRLFAVLRQLADVIVVGAGTARAETYGGARMTVSQRQDRLGRGQSEVPPIALVTRSGMLARDLAVLTDTEIAPLVLTCAAAATGSRGRLGSAAEVIDCSGGDPDQVDLGVALSRLADRGLSRVLVEGGPSLLGTFIGHGLLDEMCLTWAPVLAGGGALRIASGEDEVLTAMRRVHLLTDMEGYLYSRYVRREA